MLNIFAMSGILIVIACALMAIIMFARASSRLHIIWGVFCLAVMMWGLGAYNIGISKNPATALFWWKLAYIGVIFIPIMFTHFTYVFLNRRNDPLILSLYSLGALYLIANLFTNYFINSVHLMFNQIYFLTPTPLYNSYFALFIFLVIYSHIILFKEYKMTQGIHKQQIQYFFVASSLGFFGGSFSFLPEYQINIYPYMNLTVSFYPVIMGFAILRYRLMNISVIIAQMLIASLWVFIAARILIADFGSSEQFSNVVLLLITIVVGIFLNNSVIKEIKSREEIERLAGDLAKANEELKTLDAAKSEFISLAGHQLRAPLTAIKGYVSMVIEGSYGKIEASASEALRRVFISADQLVKLASELLDLSRIESGRFKYVYARLDFSDIIKKAIEELEEVSKEKGVAIEFLDANKENLKIMADTDKMHEIAINLIDNALKYSKEGPITIKLEPIYSQYARHLRLSVQDKGIGVAQEELNKLFTKFARTEAARQTRPEGMGLGLYFVKKIAEGHGGRVWAESEGLGKGSKFFVELPAQ